MLIPQLITGTVVFLLTLLDDRLPPEPVFALFLTFAILLTAGFLSARIRLRLPLMVLKAVLCLLTALRMPLSLLLLPLVGMETLEIFPLVQVPASGRVFLPMVLALPALILPREQIIPYFGIWAGAVFLAFQGGQRKTETDRLRKRVRTLEKELTAAEAGRARAEKAGTLQQSLAALEERDRLSRLLHDRLGHAMTGSIMQLEAAGLLFEEEPDRARETIRRVSVTLKEGLDGVRGSLASVKPDPSLLGERRVGSILGKFEADHGIAAELITTGPVRTLPAPLWQAIEENLTEALTNMMRHSSGSHFTCRIEALNRLYKVEFQDNGGGSSPVRPGMGLEGMEKRTREAGGTMIIDTSRGFSVIMLFQKGELQHGYPHSYR